MCSQLCASSFASAIDVRFCQYHCTLDVMKLMQNNGHMELIYEWFKFRMDPFKACFPQPEGNFHIILLFCWDTWYSTVFCELCCRS
jgi:hypothetical protein